MMESNTLSGINPQIDEALADTFGCIIYQEQVMKLVQLIWGMSLGEADMVRRAIGKKDPKLMAQMIEEMKGHTRAIEITDEQIEHVLNTISKSSSYLFNKSHSAAYAYTAYQTAFLKTFYPLEFYCALLNSNIDQEKTLEYISELRTRGIPVLYPNIAQSQSGWAIEGDSLRMGFAQIMGVGNAVSRRTMKLSSGYFVTFIHENRGLNKRVIENLIKAGCFDGLSPQWGIDFVEWFKSADGRKKEIEERLKKYSDNPKKVAEWKEKLKQIPPPPKYYETPIQKARDLQMEVLGMSNISIFSAYDDSICNMNSKVLLTMIDKISCFQSRRGNPTVIIEGTTKFGTAKFIASNSKVDLSSYAKYQRGMVVLIRTTYTKLDEGKRIYFFTEVSPAKEK